MRICFPTTSNEGLLSDVFGHFGSAPMLLVVDTATGAVTEQVNRDQGHAHGQCRPMHALKGLPVDAVVVGGIGAGALMGLNRAGLKVYRKTGSTIADNLTVLAQGKLVELTPDQVCGGHSGSHGHGHGHGCGNH